VVNSLQLEEHLDLIWMKSRASEADGNHPLEKLSLPPSTPIRGFMGDGKLDALVVCRRVGKNSKQLSKLVL
jgi:hypothetical protein